MQSWLSNDWWSWFLSNYSFSIALIIGLLKVLAMADERTPTDRVIDYLTGLFRR